MWALPTVFPSGLYCFLITTGIGRGAINTLKKMHSGNKHFSFTFIKLESAIPFSPFVYCHKQQWWPHSSGSRWLTPHSNGQDKYQRQGTRLNGALVQKAVQCPRQGELVVSHYRRSLWPLVQGHSFSVVISPQRRLCSSLQQLMTRL